jgi:hypothetical protein
MERLGLAAFKGIRELAWLGLVPLFGSIAALFFLTRGQRMAVVASIAAMALAMVWTMASWAGAVVDGNKAPRPLAQIVIESSGDEEIRVGCYDYYQPSLVFYCRREVRRLDTAAQTVEFLRFPLRVYLFVPDSSWRVIQDRAPPASRIIARRWDMYRRCEVLVVSNR